MTNATQPPQQQQDDEPHFDIPTKCKAGVVVNEGPDFHVEIQDVDVPSPGPDDILIRLTHTGICHSDIHFMAHDWASPPMSTFNVRSPGHEGAGVVVQRGSSVSPQKWPLGARAGIKPIHDTCGACHACWSGRDNYCAAAVLTGLRVTGTYQQYVLSPAKYATPIPADVPPELAAPVMCSASTMHRALVDSGLRAGEFVVFSGGGGGVGINGVQFARIMGMRPIVVDTGAAKRALCLSMGAEAFVDFREEPDTPAAVKRLCDNVGAHGVVVTAPQAYKHAIAYLGDRTGGKVVCVALPPADSVTIGADPNLIVFKNVHILGTLVGNQADAAAAMEYARRGLLKQICEVRPLRELPASVEQLRRGDVPGRIVIAFDME
ncbi:uncharacterized protein K452DRAFT_229934 [Aplosporella prunicola CBS 121167]|uniref:Enoyl reductase (ER) domain-containing protein n=1 Tax=Aplosporella prunicola CBS 121167 TaxID=1176127 RepID=A0A6A6BA38_9PEZI|nr:uncharacterized protein K452DRAFT_229934 [Aplosporella prunicola CBS 121167]KAF2140438.1 hypothetical protein K452DRAFT_229934 [Aplosporella prunicola CBS 121167]